MIKRVTLSFDTDIEEQKKAYDILKKFGRSKTKEITKILTNPNSEANFNYSELKERLINDKDFVDRLKDNITIKNKDKEEKEEIDESFVLNGLQGFF